MSYNLNGETISKLEQTSLS